MKYNDKESQQWKWSVISVLTKVRSAFLDYRLSALLTQERKTQERRTKMGSGIRIWKRN